MTSRDSQIVLGKRCGRQRKVIFEAIADDAYRLSQGLGAPAALAAPMRLIAIDEAAERQGCARMWLWW